MGEVVTLCAGLTKKVTKAGGGERPQQGDRCSMHYTGTLEDGTTFDTSRTRPAPLWAKSHCCCFRVPRSATWLDAPSPERAHRVRVLVVSARSSRAPPRRA